jgi:hypothetical protein
MGYIMAKKRNQYYINQFKFSNLINKGDHLEFDANTAVEFQNSENIFYPTIYRILQMKYNPEEKNTLEQIFILNAANIQANEEEQIELYRRVMSEGVVIDNVKFIRFGKSSSMAMNQRTLFVREEMHDKLKEYVSLNKEPNQTVISKYETALGLSLSSLNLIEGLPKIAIVKDFEKQVFDDVKMVVKHKNDDNDEGYKKYLKQVEIEEEYKNKSKKVNEELTSQHLRRSFPLTTDEETISKSKWNRESRRVKIDQLDKPFGYKVYKPENKAYAVYSYDQTEELPNLINKYSLGYDVKVVKNHPTVISPFDGQGLISKEYAKKLSKKIGLKHVSNGFQIRMPYVKGLVINFDIKSWFSQHGITEIIDLWNNTVKVQDLDMILTESCFKAKMEAQEGKNKWLFNSTKEYTDLLEEYGHKYVGVTNYIKSVDKTDIFTTLNYQFINSLDLSFDDLKNLSLPYGNTLMKILKHNDTASVKALINMVIKENQDDESRLDTDVQKAIDLDARMIFDPRVQKFIRNRVKEELKSMLKGRIPVRADYKFITGDCIAFMEHVSGKEVKGFLDANEFYCHGLEGEHVMMRNPITSWHEVKKGQFIKSDIEYVKHLDNVIQLNGYDLTMPQLSGADVDGDKVFLTKESIIRNAVMEDLVIVNEDDKTTANALDYNNENILKFELKNLSNETSTVTNINTLIQSYALEREDLRSSELAIATAKQLQAEFIDSVKKGTNPKIPDVLLELQNRKPYFQKFIYEDWKSTDNDYKYLEIRSPLNRFSAALETRIQKIEESRYFVTEYLDVASYDLITDMSKVNHDTFFDLVEKVAPIYNEYSSEKGAIWREERNIKKVRASEEDKVARKIIQQKYKELYKVTREKLNEVCDNPSVLTTVCAYIEYKLSKSTNKHTVRTKDYIFPWICTEDAKGLLENLKAHEEINKVDVMEIPELNRRNKDYEGLLLVENGNASIDDITFEAQLLNGKYRLMNILGQHFIDYDKQRETDVNISESKSMKREENEPVKAFESYECRLVNMDSGAAMALIMDNQVVRLDANGNYLGIFMDNKYLCGVAQESYENIDQRLVLKQHIGNEFKVKVKEEGRKSLTVNLIAI